LGYIVIISNGVFDDQTSSSGFGIGDCHHVSD
jgi:hypothetical protein